MAGENEIEDKEIPDGVDEAEDLAGTEGRETDGENEDPAGEPELEEDDGSPEDEEIAASAEGKKPGRAETRIQRLRQETQEARTREAEANRRLEQVLTQQRQQPQPQETVEMEQARLALMTPEERVDYKLAKAEQRNLQNTQAMQFQMQETADQAYFRGLIANDPMAAKHAARVEAKLVEIRKTGSNASRETILDWIVGQDIRAGRAKAAAKQKQGADRRIERQRAPAPNGKGDTPGQKRGEKSLEERLANVKF